MQALYRKIFIVFWILRIEIGHSGVSPNNPIFIVT